MSEEQQLNRAANHGDQGFWIRQEHKPHFLEEWITKVIRTGNRLDPSFVGHLRFEEIPVRFIEVPGDQNANPPRPPLLEPDDGTTVKLDRGYVLPFGQVTQDDLVGMAPDCNTIEAVREHLAAIYKRTPEDKDLVTIWQFSYLPNAKG